MASSQEVAMVSATAVVGMVLKVRLAIQYILSYSVL